MDPLPAPTGCPRNPLEAGCCPGESAGRSAGGRTLRRLSLPWSPQRTLLSSVPWGHRPPPAARRAPAGTPERASCRSSSWSSWWPWVVPRGTRWGDTSWLAGTRLGCGALEPATPHQQLQPRCTACSASRTRPSRACRPRSGRSRAGEAPGGSPRPRPGGRLARSTRCAESSHLRRIGEAAPRASRSPQPGAGRRRLSRAFGPHNGPRRRREGGSRGGTSAGDSAAQDGPEPTAPTTVSNPCASPRARTGGPAAGRSSASAARVSAVPAARSSFPRKSSTPGTRGPHRGAPPRPPPVRAGAQRPGNTPRPEPNRGHPSCHRHQLPGP